MKRLEELFTRKPESVLNIYCTAGFPKVQDTLRVIQSLAQYGADIIELGMPYSDPVADGKTIQNSDYVALKNGMTVHVLFEQLKNMRQTVQLPVILMGYLNPVLQYGFEKFCAKAAEVGIDGFIIPDLPPYEFEKEYREIVQKYNLDFIFLVTPETPEAKIKKLDTLSSGFLYAVTSSSTTGGDKDFSVVEAYLERLKNLNLKNPILAGFGVKDKSTFQTVCRKANGAIIGSAYIKALQQSENVEQTTATFLKGLLT